MTKVQGISILIKFRESLEVIGTRKWIKQRHSPPNVGISWNILFFFILAPCAYRAPCMHILDIIIILVLVYEYFEQRPSETRPLAIKSILLFYDMCMHRSLQCVRIPAAFWDYFQQYFIIDCWRGGVSSVSPLNVLYFIWSWHCVMIVL